MNEREAKLIDLMGQIADKFDELIESLRTGEEGLDNKEDQDEW